MKTEPLFDLINSLTMSEKRFFKIFSQRHVIGETNQYLLLFDFIDNNTPMSTELLEKQGFVKNLSAEKNYLYRLILKSLNAYYFEFSFKMKVQNTIISAEILAYKGLENQALKLLDKAEKLANEAELYSHVLTIKQTQFEILSKISHYDQAITILYENNPIIQKQFNLIDVQKQTTDLYNLRQKQGGIRTKDELDELNRFVTTQQKDGFDSKKSLLFQTSLNISYSHAIKDFESELNNLFKIIELYEENPFLIEYSTKGYVSSIYNLANTYRNLNKLDLAVSTLNRLDQLSNNRLIATSKQLSSYAFYLSNNLRLFIYILQNKFDLAQEHYLLIKNDYHLHENNIEKTVVYEHLMLIIRIQIELKNYKLALKYSNIIINDTSYNQREDILSFIRLLNLVIHFELKNDLTIDYLSNSALNYLKRRQRLFKTEKEIINFIKKYTLVNNDGLKKMNEKLIQLKQDPYEANMYRFFDFQKWVESKIKSKY